MEFRGPRFRVISFARPQALSEMQFLKTGHKHFQTPHFCRKLQARITRLEEAGPAG
jgi:hypothetical protein